MFDPGYGAEMSVYVLTKTFKTNAQLSVLVCFKGVLERIRGVFDGLIFSKQGTGRVLRWPAGLVADGLVSRGGRLRWGDLLDNRHQGVGLKDKLKFAVLHIN
jgi:hypothetical protein